MRIDTRKGSAARAWVDYFTANPYGELSYADAMAKFGMTYRAVVVAAQRLRDVGTIESVHTVRLRRPKR